MKSKIKRALIWGYSHGVLSDNTVDMMIKEDKNEYPSG